MSLKMAMPGILRYLGYRRVLISNTIILGLLIMLFASIGVGTPVWLIVAQALVFGFFTSLQYTSMNTRPAGPRRDGCSPRPGRHRPDP
jgi:hypothetical protein